MNSNFNDNDRCAYIFTSTDEKRLITFKLLTTGISPPPPPLFHIFHSTTVDHHTPTSTPSLTIILLSTTTFFTTTFWNVHHLCAVLHIRKKTNKTILYSHAFFFIQFNSIQFNSIVVIIFFLLKINNFTTNNIV
ncbi:hypothetical protein T11_1281 [Trichinella zimbabwensis]|uniref:Uncharacterized protein n=1 Tax=Trichinella zimbabwensis TaxID=268475 RepID=A0A0V1H276_9BILA|nr:hypothetical protein T11_1281 [Trichinella zimbabwensis]